MQTANRILGEIDPWTGWLISLKTPGYSDDPNVVGRGDGVYTAEDWSHTRQKGLSQCGTDGSEFDSDENYLRYIFGAEGMNVIGAIALAQHFDFGRYRSIFEIGCGDMAQAYILHRLHPHTQYVATDLDPYIIERCAKLSVLDGIEKKALDILSVPQDKTPFAGFDLLVSWGMEYALNDTQLLQLFALGRRHRVPYLLCSATTTGLGKYLRYLVRMPQRARRIKARQLRMSGWERSPLRFYRLARQAGLRMKVLGRFGYHFCMLLEPDSKPSRR